MLTADGWTWGYRLFDADARTGRRDDGAPLRRADHRLGLYPELVPARDGWLIINPDTDDPPAVAVH